MNAPIETQYINGSNGKPEFVVIPYYVFKNLTKKISKEQPVIPNEVVQKTILDGIGIIRAWREYLELTQCEVASRMGITQSAYSQLEGAKNTRQTTRKKIANALGLDIRQLV